MSRLHSRTSAVVPNAPPARLVPRIAALALVAGTYLMAPPNATAQGGGTARARAASSAAAGRRVLIELRDGERARSLLEAAVASDSTYGPALFDLGVLAEAREDWEDAKRWFGRYLTVDDTSKWAERARVELARVDAARTADAAPGGVNARRYRTRLEIGRRLLAAGDARGALAQAEAAAVDSAAGWESYALAAAALTKLQRWDPALAMLDSATAREAPATVTDLRDQVAPLAAVHPALAGVSNGAFSRALDAAVAEARLGASPADAFSGVRGAKTPDQADSLNRRFRVVRFPAPGSEVALDLWVANDSSSAELGMSFPVDTARAAEARDALAEAAAARLSEWQRSDEAVGNDPGARVLRAAPLRVLVFVTEGAIQLSVARDR